MARYRRFMMNTTGRGNLGSARAVRALGRGSAVLVVAITMLVPGAAGCGAGDDGCTSADALYPECTSAQMCCFGEQCYVAADGRQFPYSGSPTSVDQDVYDYCHCKLKPTAWECQ